MSMFDYCREESGEMYDTRKHERFFSFFFSEYCTITI